MLYVLYIFFQYTLAKALLVFRGDKEESKDTKIIAVDLQAMAPIPGVVQIQGDITKVNSKHLSLALHFCISLLLTPFYKDLKGVTIDLLGVLLAYQFLVLYWIKEKTGFPIECFGECLLYMLLSCNLFQESKLPF